MNDWWPYVLKQEGRDELGELLAKHPEAMERAERLTSDLTVTKLVRIANAEYNYCRLGRDIPPNPDAVARSDQAWRTLELKARTLVMKEQTAWTRTISLLSDSAPEALTALSALPINRVIVACERLIKGPYRAKTKSGNLPRW
jgi:hypothetical protein